MSKWTDEQLEQALRALVLANLNVKLAQERLLSAGLDIAERTLSEWKNIHAERLEQLQEQRDVWVALGLADQAEFMAAAEGEVELKLARVLLSMSEEQLSKKMSPNVIALAMKATATSKAINIDKSLALRGKPSKIVRSEVGIDELMRQIQRKFPDVIEVKRPDLIESTATEESPEPSRSTSGPTWPD